MAGRKLHSFRLVHQQKGAFSNKLFIKNLRALHGKRLIGRTAEIAAETTATALVGERLEVWHFIAVIHALKL